MKKRSTRWLYGCLWLLISALAVPALAQSQPALTKRESDNISFLAKKRLELLNQLLNNLTYDGNEEFDINTLIKNSLQPTNTNQVFYNDLVTIEDDIDPSHNSAENTADVPVDTYLNNLASFYSKTPEPNTIVFSKQFFYPVQQNGDVLYIKGFFTSVFKGRHRKIDKPYLPTDRVVEMRADKENNKWQVRIIRLGFPRPGEGSDHVAAGKPVTSGATAAPADNGRPAIPDNLSINSPEVPFRQPENNTTVSLKFNRNWLEVVQSSAADVPLGFYQRKEKLYVYDNLNTIEFLNNNSRFIFHKGLEYKGYERVLTGRVLPAKPDSVAKPVAPGPTPRVAAAPTGDRATDAKTKAAKDKPVAVVPETKTPTVALNTPDAAKPTEPTRRESKQEKPVKTTPDITLSTPDAASAVTAPARKPVPEKSIVAVPVPKAPGPTVANALDAEAKKQKARYRTQGWIQVVAGVAGLAGSYMAYSSIKKDYDVYTTRVNELNSEYNAWAELARQPSGSPMQPLSITSYGKPGIYGAYAGGGISAALIINGIRSLGKAGKVKVKSVN